MAALECTGCELRIEEAVARCPRCKHPVLPVGSAELRVHRERRERARGRSRYAILGALACFGAGAVAAVFGAWGLGEVLALGGLVLSIAFAALRR